MIWSVVVKDPLSVAIGATEDPLTCEANRSLASDADPLNAEVSPSKFLASEAEPLKAATEALIA